MKVVIVEDEPMAASSLEQALLNCAPDAEILTRLTGVSETIAWLSDNGYPDLLFLDIRLRDGLAWEIFAACDVTCPVIFTTAYDNYLMRAFSVNGIEYLLKPVEPERLAGAVRKYRQLKNHFIRYSSDDIAALKNPDAVPNKLPRRRLLVRKGCEFISMPIESVSYLFSEQKLTFMVDYEGECYMLDDSLTDIENQIDKNLFFRANRQYLVALDAILRFRSTGKGTLELELRQLGKRLITISQARAGDFRRWIER